MKILTKKKQEKILELLIESGIALAKDARVPLGAYHKVNETNYAIANLVGGFETVNIYHNSIDRVLANMGGK